LLFALHACPTVLEDISFAVTELVARMLHWAALEEDFFLSCCIFSIHLISMYFSLFVRSIFVFICLVCHICTVSHRVARLWLWLDFHR